MSIDSGTRVSTLDSTTHAFLADLGSFAYELSSLDHVWRVLFPDKKGEWHHVHVNKYQRIFYVTDVDGNRGSLEAEPGKPVRPAQGMGSPYMEGTWEPLFEAARAWLSVVRKDWLKANRRVHLEYPLQRRYGIVPSAIIRALVPDIRRLDKELGKSKSRKLVNLVEQGFFSKSENTEVAAMTAADYFRYCKIAYIAGKRKGDAVDESLSGRQMYQRFADGRHEGLLDIDPDSKEEFARWIDGTHPKRDIGGHPWEIKRGGNSTHIDLSVYRPPYKKEGFVVELRGESSGRMVETMRMFLAIQEAGLPITMANPEGVRKRLLAQDNIGIVPSNEYANRHFLGEQDVFDAWHYDELGRHKRRIRPFITWEPLPIMKPA